MKLAKHLYKHPQGCFYFVLTIPKPLQGHFQGFPRVRYSLGTKYPAKAKIEAYKHTTYFAVSSLGVQGEHPVARKLARVCISALLALPFFIEIHCFLYILTKHFR